MFLLKRFSDKDSEVHETNRYHLDLNTKRKCTLNRCKKRSYVLVFKKKKILLQSRLLSVLINNVKD